MDDGFNFKGWTIKKLYDENGNLKTEQIDPNLVTTAGFDWAAQRLFDTLVGSPATNYIAIGSGTVAANVSDTVMGGELSRSVGAYAHTVGQKNCNHTVTFAAGAGTGSITEAGMLNSGATGYLFCRQTFAQIAKGASDSLQITWAFSLS
jgi:tryptophan synthase beta subunit